MIMFSTDQFSQRKAGFIVAIAFLTLVEVIPICYIITVYIKASMDYGTSTSYQLSDSKRRDASEKGTSIPTEVLTQSNEEIELKTSIELK